MMLPLRDCFLLIEEVAEINKVKLPTSMPKPIKEGEKVDVGSIPMWIASCGELKIDQEQRMHFIDIVKLTMRVVITGNDANAMKEIRETEEDNPAVHKMLGNLEEQQKKRQSYHVMTAQSTF